MAWEVHLHDAVADWLQEIRSKDPDLADKITAALDMLADEGPTLPRPFVDKVNGSKHHNMKELRPRGTGRRQFRILFAFDPEQQAICLVGGEKTNLWNRWYPKAIKLADKRYDEHLSKREEGNKR